MYIVTHHLRDTASYSTPARASPASRQDAFHSAAGDREEAFGHSEGVNREGERIQDEDCDYLGGYRISCTARGLPSGPGSEEELHDGGVTLQTSNLQGSPSILRSLVDVCSAIHQQPSHLRMALM